MNQETNLTLLRRHEVSCVTKGATLTLLNEMGDLISKRDKAHIIKEMFSCH